MRSWAFTFFILTVIAGLMGFTQLITAIATFSQHIFFFSMIVFVVTFIFYFLKKNKSLLPYILIFAAIAAVSAVIAYTNFAGITIELAKIAFYVFLLLFVITLVLYNLRKKA